MNRLKLLAAIALLGLPLAACEEATPPPPVGSIMGQVSIEGQGIDGVSVTLSNGAATSTAGGGTYRFDNVEGGTYTVNISGFPADASFDATSGTATIGASGETATVNFSGSYIRTASVMGTVTVENKGLGGVTVRLTGMADATTATDNSGQYAFTGLRAGTYSVDISGFNTDDVSFSGNTAKSVTVDVGASQIVTFEGTYLRTAGIMGQVSVEGAGIEGVTVSLSGGEEDATTMTDASGQYGFAKLRAGDYSVGISGYDTDEYEFEVTSRSVSVALGETENVPFEGNLLRTAGISGRVAVEGTGIEGVTVTLSGAGDDTATDTTEASGQYGFAGLVEGNYTVAISGYDENAYSFATTSADVTVGDSQSKIQNFDGSHTTTASVSGQMFIDWTGDDMFNAGEEDPLAMAGVPVSLQGPGVSEVKSMVTGEDGSYMFAELKAGDYRVLVVPTTIAKELAAAGLQYGGSGTGTVVTVTPGMSATANFPFDITHQTITVQAALSADTITGDPVEGVAMDLYATFQDADGGNNKIASDTTDSTGTATFMFARTADVGPAGTPDQLVFTKVSSVPHDDLSVTANETMEVIYAARDQTAKAPNTVGLVNRRANISFWVKNFAAPNGDGDEPQADWQSHTRGDPTHSGTRDGTKTDKTGMAFFTDAVGVSDLPATYYINISPSEAKMTAGEKYTQTAEPNEGAATTAPIVVGEDKPDTTGTYLVYTHNGLQLPGDTADLGVMRVRYITQSLTVGVHWERDQVEGFSHEDIGGHGDKRATSDLDNIDVTLMYPDPAAGGRLRKWTSTDKKHDIVKKKNPRSPTSTGLVTFKNLPADIEFTARARVSGRREMVGDDEVDAYAPQASHSAGVGDGHMTGSFGENGGTGPVVEVCPLASSADMEDCSTFGYVATNHIIHGEIASENYHGAVDTVIIGKDAEGKDITRYFPVQVFADSVTVSLTVVSSLAGEDAETKVSRQFQGQYRFPNLPSGKYKVTVDGDDTWGISDSEASVEAIANSRAEVFYYGSWNSFFMKYQKTSISGTVANDDNGDGTVTGSEAAAGVTLKLRRIQTRVPRSTKTPRDSVVVATTTTDGDGGYSFTNVEEGDYVVEADSDDYYVRAANEENDVSVYTRKLTTSALADTTAVRNTARKFEDADKNRLVFHDRKVTGGNRLPMWVYKTSEIGNDPGAEESPDADFILLHMDGEIEGKVTRKDDGDITDKDSDPDPVAIDVTAQLCKSYNAGEKKCTTYVFKGDRTVSTDPKTGKYVFDVLREGYYEVSPNIRGSQDSTPDKAILELLGRNAGAVQNFTIK